MLMNSIICHNQTIYNNKKLTGFFSKTNTKKNLMLSVKLNTQWRAEKKRIYVYGSLNSKFSLTYVSLTGDNLLSHYMVWWRHI